MQIQIQISIPTRMKKKKAINNNNYSHYKKFKYKKSNYFIKYPEKIPEWWSKKYKDFKKNKNKFKNNSKPADLNKGLITKSGIRDNN